LPLTPTFDLIFVGFGNVARRAARLLEEMGPRLPFTARTVAIVTGHHGATCENGWPATLPPPATDGSSNAHVVAALAEHHRAAADEGRLICVETTVLDIRAGEPAISHVRAALSGGAHVVTANKGPAAFAYADLAALALSVERQFLFEGAVMDGIPIFNLVRETLPGVRIESFRGVINSTTNHILTMLERGVTFDVALREMQEAGIAEADPMLDVEGWDAAAKTAALMNVLMDARVTPHEITREGVRHVSAKETRAARDHNQRLRLVASAGRSRGTPIGRVQLEKLPADDILARLDGQQNALVLGTDLLGDIAIVQRHGGLTQTAFAIVSDLAKIARQVPLSTLPHRTP
jgi:homoserine dehydrogenase